MKQLRDTMALALKDALAQEQAATPGEWRVDEQPDYDENGAFDGSFESGEIVWYQEALDDLVSLGQMSPVDTRLACLSRNAIPYALAAWQARLDAVIANWNSPYNSVARAELRILARELCWDENVAHELARVEREGGM